MSHRLGLFVLPLSFGLACSGTDKDDGPEPGSDSGQSEDTAHSDDTAHGDDTGDIVDTGDTTDTGEHTDPLSEEEQQAQDAYDAFLAEIPEADLSTAEQVTIWSQTSAPNLFMQVLVPTFMVGDQISQWQEAGNSGLPDCPVYTGYDETGQVVGMEASVVGDGCTDFKGTQWLGSNTQSMSKDGNILLVNNGFGTIGPSPECTDRNDTLLIHSYTEWSYLSEDTVEIDMLSALDAVTHTTDSSCMPVEDGLATDVVMTQLTEMVGDAEQNTWNHVGHAAINSDGVTGHMDVETTDEVTNDSLCTTEALSGTTRFTTSTQTAAVHYDGATDCDLESTVTWTLDGVGQGEISGISCASVSNRLGWVGMLFSMFAVLWGRRNH